MPTELNGRPKGSKGTAKPSMNGQPNGSASHTLDTRSTRGKRRSRTSYTGWVVDKGLKLTVWYFFITLLFRCPSSPAELTDESPILCKPYLQARGFVTPYAKPYYDQYAAPYIQKAQPYVDQVYDKAYKPVLAAYHQHAAPRVAQAQRISQQQWEKTVKPQLEVARQQAGKHYQAVLGPHVKKAQDTLQPHYDSLKTSASDIWELEIQPIYRQSYPYAHRVYTQSSEFAITTLLPQAQYVGNATWAFWARQIWPKMRVLYGENVEPQLMRITERLGRYKDEKKLQAEVKSMASSSKLAKASSSVASASSSLSSTITEPTQSPSSAASVAASSSASPSANAKVQFHEDLQSWESVCSKAVDEGAEDLRERINEITSHQISHQAQGVGAALVVQLEETSIGVINSVKAHILSTVASAHANEADEYHEKAYEALAQGIRAAGKTIKQRAQAIREWHQSYTSETKELVGKALQSTLETIDGIRELRLTEIGRKYADSGLSHKDWSKYMELKKATQAWRNDVEEVVMGHPGVAGAKEAGEEVEHRGMTAAEQTAKELGRLKDVGKWKIAAGDESEDFSTKHVPPVAERARQQIVENVGGVSEKVSEAVVGGSQQGAVESATSVASERVTSLGSSASSAAQRATEGVRDSGEPKGSGKSAASQARKSAKSAASAASDGVVGTHSGVSDSATDLASSATSSATSRLADKPLSGTLGPKAASILAAGKAKKDAASSCASSVADEAATSVSSAADHTSVSASSVTDRASSGLSSAPSAASQDAPDPEDIKGKPDQAKKRVFGGAMAQAVLSASGPILGDDIVDDEGSYSERIQSMANGALEQASLLTQALTDAIKPATSTQGSVESMTSLASEQYESAIAAASSVLFEKWAGEKGGGAARERYLSAVTAASYAIYGTPSTAAAAASITSAYSSILAGASQGSGNLAAAASSRYNEAMSQASSQYDAAKSRISVQVSGTPEPVHKQMFASAESAYSNVLAGANQQYQAALSAAPTGVPSFGSSKGVYESISSIASLRLAEGLSAASAQYESAKVAVGVETTPAHQQYLASAQAAYYQGVGMAHDRYSQFLKSASSAVGARPTPAYQGYLAAAQNSYSSAVAAASSNMLDLLGSASSVVGATTKSPAQSVLDSISSQYDAAVAAASSQLGVAQSAVGATPTPAYQGYLAAAQSSYSSAVAVASSNMADLMDSASSVAGVSSTPVTQSFLDSLSSSYDAAVSAASAQLSGASVQASEAIYGTSLGVGESAASVASSAIYGTDTPWTEAMASQASENWEALVSRASEQVYGAPPPFTASVASQAGAYAAQATQAAAEQFAGIQALFSELVSGKEPDFTESVYNRLHAAYYTGAPAMAFSASSYASEAYASASSIVSSVFTPPPTIEAVLSQVTDQLNSAVDAASAQVYGSSKGTLESATQAAGTVYDSAASQVSEAIYGHPTGYAEAASSSMSHASESASKAIYAALFGTPTGTLEAATSGASNAYASISSVAAEHLDAAGLGVANTYASASSAVSSAIYGPEQGAMESAQSRILQAVESARLRMEELGSGASRAAADTVARAQEAAEGVASSVGSVAGAATERARDEL